MNNMTMQLHSQFLESLFRKFNAANILYCITRNYDALPEVILDDIDILIDIDHLLDIDRIIKSATGNDFLLIKRVNRNYHIQYYITSDKELKKSIKESRAAEIIELDFVYELQWKGIPYLKAKEVLCHRVPYKDFYILDRHHHIVHVMYHALLDKNFIKQEYALIIKSGFEAHNKNVMQSLSPLLGSRLCEQLAQVVQAGDEQKILSLRSLALFRLILHPVRFTRLTIFVTRKYLRISKAILSPPGVLITAVGPDGVGKTTLLARCRLALSNSYDPEVDIYMGWKEFILPSKRILLALLKLSSNRSKNKEVAQDEESMQRADEPEKPSWTHNISVVHYFADLMARYVIKIRPVLARGGLATCDRYFYDVLTQNVWLTNSGVSRWLLIKLSPSPTLTIICWRCGSHRCKKKRKHC